MTTMLASSKAPSGAAMPADTAVRFLLELLFEADPVAVTVTVTAAQSPVKVPLRMDPSVRL